MFSKNHIIAACATAIILIAIGIALFFSSRDGKEKERGDFRVLVVHGYDTEYYGYDEFNKTLLNTMEDDSVRADVKNVYMNLIYPSQTGREELERLRREMDSEGWKPDVIVAEGDRALNALMENGNDSILTEIKTVPTVIGALHHPDWDMLRKWSNFVIFTDPLDYCTNIELAQEFSGVNIIEVEIDNMKQDKMIREELRKAIARQPYVDNTDLHDRRLSEEDRLTIWKDSTMVLALSAASPEMNVSDADTLSGKAFTTNVFKYAYRYPNLVVKRDIYSQMMAKKTDKPQFTAVKAGFADGKGSFLCGYFASYKTVATDIAHCVSKIATGKDYRRGNHQHHKEFFMDYKAMKIWGLEYDDYKDRFNIVGAPAYKKHPYLIISLAALALITLLAFVVTLASIINKIRMRNATNLRHELEKQREITMLAMTAMKAYTLTSIQDIENVIDRLDDNGKRIAPAIRMKYREEGSHVFRLHFALTDNDEEEWWQMRFAVTNSEDGTPIISGMLRNISQLVEAEQSIEETKQKAMEAKDKRMLIRNMTSAINKPLSEILKASDALANDDYSMSDEQRMILHRQINDSNAELMALINDVLSFSRLESRKTEYKMSLHHARTVCDDVFEEWKDKMPPGVALMKNYGREDATYWGDEKHVKEILSQFMSNAVKFTKKDSISIGYKNHLSIGITQLFVEDAGCGIPEDKRQQIFNAFYKGDAYISGVGLGLNIATLLAVGMNGHVQVSSEMGVGSKFSVRLKTKEPEGEE